MNSLLRFFDQYEVFLYLIFGGLFIVFARKSWLAWREWSIAQFGLEKENAQAKFNQGLTILVFSGLIGLGLFLVNTFITPSVPGVEQLPTPQVTITEPPLKTTEITPEIPSQGLIPTITSFLGRGCVPGQIDWTDPVNDGVISGLVELKGTINIQNLGFYKYEFSKADSENWTTIAAGNSVVIDGPLGGAWDSGNLDPGDYKLRLVVTDNQNNPLPECSIQITIKGAE